MSEQGMRPSILWMAGYFDNKPVRGVELGVFKGINAERFLSMLNVESLDLVDLWITPDCLKHQFDYVEHERMVREKFKDDKRINIFKIDTVEATEYVDDDYLDFVYVDADHSYEGCKRDMNAWWSKIKKGGVMVGHDYHCCEGVHKAVIEFLVENNITKQQFKIFDAIGIYDKCRYGEWVIIK